jgi:phosphoglycerate dehydrogenase-like enzyme
MMLVLIYDAFDSSLPNRLRALGVEVTEGQGPPSRVHPESQQHEVHAGVYLDVSAALKMIIRGGVGLDNVDRAHAAQKEIAMHNTPETSSIEVTSGC